MSIIYASEADVLNVALFGVTAKDWRDKNPDLKGNIRDYANIAQLVCLSNFENLNAVLIGEGIVQAERLKIKTLNYLKKKAKIKTIHTGAFSLPVWIVSFSLSFILSSAP